LNQLTANTIPSDNKTREQLILDNLELIHPKKLNHVIEVRILGLPRNKIVSGYYQPDSFASIPRAIAKYEKTADGIYITLNPVNPDLLARAKNRLVEYAKKTTGDKDIVRYNWLLVDIDPKRASGISSSDNEKENAKQVAGNVFKGLVARGFSKPLLCDSGNAYHLLFRINLPNNEYTKQLIGEALKAISLLYGTENIEIDTSVGNPAGLTKLYGTKARKGDDIEERPHRFSKILQIPENLKITDIEQLKNLPSLLPKPNDGYNQAHSYNSGKFDLEAKLREYGLDVIGTKPYEGGTLYRLKECPNDSSHKNGKAFVTQFPNGALAAGCFHNSCKHIDWHWIRNKFEPGWKKKKQKKKNAPENTLQENNQNNSSIIYTPQIRGRLEEIKQSQGVSSGNHCFNDIIQSAENFLYLTPDTKYVLKTTTASVLANYSVDDPVWLQIIAPPSSAKTEIILGHSGIPEAWNKSSLTSKTLISGERSNEKASLLLQIGRFGIFLIKDFTTILELPYNERAEIFAQLREIYDGYYSKSFGTGKTISWYGKLGIVSGCTPIIEKYTPNLTALGERFLFARIDDYTKEYEDKALDKALGGDSEEISNYRDSLKNTISEFVKSRLDKAIDFKLVLNNDHINTLKKYSRFIAKVRSNVVRDTYNRDSILVKPFSESPMRVSKQLMSILKGLCITDNCESPKDEHFAHLARLTLDNLPPLKREFIDNVTKEGTYRVDLARALGYSENNGFFKRNIEDLARLEIVRTDKDKGKVIIYRSEIINEFYSNLLISLIIVKPSPKMRGIYTKRQKFGVLMKYRSY